MLSSSPRLYIPPESDFFPRFFGKNPHRELSEREAQAILDMIFGEYRLVKEWQSERLMVAELDRPITPSSLLHHLYQRYAEQHGAVRWGDKTPVYTSYIPLLLDLFPNAKIIHLVRDGRDVALSMVKKWGARKRHVDLFFGAMKWRERLESAEKAATPLSSTTYLKLYYEQLIADPETHLRTICTFLDEPFFPEMAQPQQLAQTVLKHDTFHAAVRQPVRPKQKTWRDTMPDRDVRLVQHIAGRMLRQQGYALADVGQMTGRDWVRYFSLMAKYHAFQFGRNLLQTLGYFPPN